ncbi:MAG: tyrosine-protein phosphatase [Clostridiales bacterium]|nr:tyrosine-protein phosphatase [Clostridiales bacterium]
MNKRFSKLCAVTAGTALLVSSFSCSVVLAEETTETVTEASTESDAEAVVGTVTELEKYGHAVLNITIEDFEALGFELGDIVTVSTGDYAEDMPYLDGYYVDTGEAMLRAYPGMEYIAVCINYGKFCEVAGVDVGSEITIELKEAGGAAAMQATYSLVYTNERDDYDSDEIFANFRMVSTTGMGEGKLYRSASPVSSEIGRASIADDLCEAAGIRTVMNMADTEEELEEYLASEDFDSDYYKTLCEEGNVIFLGMPLNYSSDEFARDIVSGLTFLAEHETPYLIHCTEGKDRAGFASALLEALMGAAPDEIADDYMTSYVNYYSLDATEDAEKYNLIAEGNIMEMLRAIAGLEEDAVLTDIDLAEAAQNYLLENGMSEDSLSALMENLR